MRLSPSCTKTVEDFCCPQCLLTVTVPLECTNVTEDIVHTCPVMSSPTKWTSSNHVGSVGERQSHRDGSNARMEVHDDKSVEVQAHVLQTIA